MQSIPRAEIHPLDGGGWGFRTCGTIIAQRRIAGAIRCDNGPEFTSRHFLGWCVERQIGLIHIQPGKPTKNGRVESFHGRLREECLHVSWFQNQQLSSRGLTGLAIHPLAS
jgi:putative transposase